MGVEFAGCFCLYLSFACFERWCFVKSPTIATVVSVDELCVGVVEPSLDLKGVCVCLCLE